MKCQYNTQLIALMGLGLANNLAGQPIHSGQPMLPPHLPISSEPQPSSPMSLSANSLRRRKQLKGLDFPLFCGKGLYIYIYCLLFFTLIRVVVFFASLI